MYVDRDPDGKIVGRFTVQQRADQEHLDDEAIVVEMADATKYPPPRIVVSRLRVKLELAERGLLAKVDDAVQAAGETPLLYWREATSFESDHPLVLKIGGALGLSDSDIRALFEAAATRDA